MAPTGAPTRGGSPDRGDGPPPPASAALMRAVVHDRYGTADVLELRDVPRPGVGPDAVLVRVRAAGVDRGVWHLMTGRPYLLRLAGYGVRRPRHGVLGADVAGVVEAVGEGVTRFRPGDEVFGTCDGAFAQWATARQDRLAPKPPALTFEQAAAVPTSASTALQAVRDHGRVEPGQHVLVLGASGGVGGYAVQLAKAFGAEVTGVASGAKLDLVRALGADHALDYAVDDPTGGERRYDVILDIAGNRPLRHLRRALTPRGTLVLVGGEGGGRWVGSTVTAELRALAVRPFLRQHLRMFVARQRASDLEDLVGLLEAGKVVPAVDRAFPLAEAADAIRCLEAGRVRGKLVLTV